MMKMSLDYLDRRVFRKREGEILLPDGTRRLVSDKFSVEFFEFLKMKYSHSSSYNSVYSSENKEIIIKDEDDFEISVQEKGLFFLSEDWKKNHDLSTEYLVKNKVAFHYTRADLCFTTKDDLRPLIDKIDVSKFSVAEFKKNGISETFTAGNSRFEFTYYNKSRQLKRIKNEHYLKLFKDNYPEDRELFRLEFRLRGKDTLAKIPSLMSENIHLGKVAEEFFEAIQKRLILPRKLKKQLQEVIENEDRAK